MSTIADQIRSAQKAIDEWPDGVRLAHGLKPHPKRYIRERDIERLLVKRCRERGWLCLKFVSPGARGVPDRIVLKPGQFHNGTPQGAGGAEFIELKAPGEKPTAAQLRWHKRLHERGFTVSVLDSKEGVEAFVSAP